MDSHNNQQNGRRRIVPKNACLSSGFRNVTLIYQVALSAIVYLTLTSFSLGQAIAAAASGQDLIHAAGIHGGLIVHVGCGDGEMTAALFSPSFVVHGLDIDDANIEAARRRALKSAQSGAVSFDTFNGTTLPYVDGLANVLVVSSGFDLTADEIARVLAPRGVALIRNDTVRIDNSPALQSSAAAPSGWRMLTKRVPDAIDEWTHFLHGPDGHVMSNDSAVGPPFHIQWVGSPRHAKSHAHLTTVNVMVSSGGRLFYIADESLRALPDSLPSRWALIARDAFNGIELWRRPLSSWQPYYVADRNSYPADLHRRLVAVDDVVFTTLSILGPVSALDAATGRIIRTYTETEKTEDIVCSDGVLYLSINTGDADQIDRLKMAYRHVEPQQKRVRVLQADSGRLLWEKCDDETNGLMPMTLAVKNDHVYFQNAKHVVCLAKATGDVVWKANRPSEYFRPGWSSPSLVAFDDVVISADRQSGPGQKIGKDKFAAGGFSTGNLVAFSASDGKQLWSAPCAEGCRAPTDVFSLNNELWFGKTLERRAQEYRQVHDLHTGEILRETPLEKAFPNWHHHRCYRDKSTCQYILGSRTGVEFIDLKTGKVSLHNWIRGSCKFGILPCNGLLYVPPDQCGCYPESKLTGFHALAPKRASETRSNDPQAGPARAEGSTRLVRGPAYGKPLTESATKLAASDWPTFRADNARSGGIDTGVPTDLKQAWRVKLNGRLTQPVVAAGRLFVPSIDENTLHILDANTGKTLHTVVVGSRIDSPPTIAGALAVFGGRDGWIYAIDYASGQLAWRYLAGFGDDKLMDNGRVESVWPLHGSVLIQDNSVYFAAGRSSYVDGGVRMGKLDLATGEPILEKSFSSRDPETGDAVQLYGPFQTGNRLQPFEMPGVLPDVLSSDGKYIWMRAANFDTQLTLQPEFVDHLFSSIGFLDDSWWELSYWIFGNHMFGGRSGIAQSIGLYPTARIMVCDAERVYGYQDGYETIPAAMLVATNKQPKKTGIKGEGRYRHVSHDWSQSVPLHAFGLVRAGDTLFLAGPPKVDTEKTRELLKTMTTDAYDPPRELQDAVAGFTGVRGGVLCAVATKDGKLLMQTKLDSIPVFDGVIAANNRLYIAMKDGSVVCLH